MPQQFKQFRATWMRYHPNSEHRFWTDKDNLEFLEKYYAWFVPTYEMYPENIMRADAARYFILKHYGGIYVDLDFECLRSVDQLLENKQLVIGCEPPSHLYKLSEKPADGKILCNAFIASVPQHPFLDHLIHLMTMQKITDDVLISTGPLLASQAYSTYPNKADISIESYRKLYPVDKDQIYLQRSSWDLDDAYAIHHWQGTWWRGRGLIRMVQRLLWNTKNE